MVFLFLASAGIGPAPTQEIEALLTYIGGLEGASFVRNGSSHSAGAAVSHMRLKWRKQEKNVRSAEDFIALCGSKSSISGDRYLIRFKDGTQRFCDDVLTEQLHALREKADQPVQPAPPKQRG